MAEVGERARRPGGVGEESRRAATGRQPRRPGPGPGRATRPAWVRPTSPAATRPGPRGQRASAGCRAARSAWRHEALLGGGPMTRKRRGAMGDVQLGLMVDGASGRVVGMDPTGVPGPDEASWAAACGLHDTSWAGPSNTSASLAEIHRLRGQLGTGSAELDRAEAAIRRARLQASEPPVTREGHGQPRAASSDAA